MAFEFHRPLVFPEGLQIAFENPESSLRIYCVNTGRSKSYYPTPLFPYDPLRVFYVTRRFGEVGNFSGHYGSLVYKGRQRIGRETLGSTRTLFFPQLWPRYNK